MAIKKGNSYTWLDYVVPKIFAGVHFGYWKNTFRSHSFLINEYCLNKASLQWLLSKLYIILSMPSALGFRVQPERTMTITTIELLYYQDWYYLISTNMASLLWTYEDEKLNTTTVILCPPKLSNFWQKLLMLSKIIK